MFEDDVYSIVKEGVHHMPLLGGSGGMPPQKMFEKWML